MSTSPIVTSPNVTMQQKRGPKANLPTVAPAGQLIVTTDTNELYVGTGTGVVQVGGNSETYIFTQTSANALWTINHNLGKYPSVTLVDNDGEQVDAKVEYSNANQIICEFSPAMAGKAYLN